MSNILIFLPIILAGAINADLGKGVGNPWQNHECTHQQLNVDWWYNWLTVDTEECGGNFIPMVWSTRTGQQLLDGNLELADSEFVLYLNEPNDIRQANNTPAEAAAMFRQLQAKYPGRKCIVGNLVNGGGWLDEFFVLCNDCDIYGVGIHHYAWDCSASGLNAALDKVEKYGKPIFVTEFGCFGETSYQIASYEKWFDIMDVRTEGYAAYSTQNPNGFPVVFDSLNLVDTSLGNWYAVQ